VFESSKELLGGEKGSEQELQMYGESFETF
jgi:hypothetical protein